MRTTLVLIVAGTIAIGWLLSAASTTRRHVASPEPSSSTVTVNQIVSRLQTVQELASLKVSVSGIVRGRQAGLRFWQGESSMVLLVRGMAIYSVDLSGVDVVVNGNAVTITLPEPRITDHWVDVDRTEIWERQTGRFRLDEGLSLDAACWAGALAMVYEASLAESHQETARIRVERIVAELLSGASRRISVQVRWA